MMPSVPFRLLLITTIYDVIGSCGFVKVPTQLVHLSTTTLQYLRLRSLSLSAALVYGKGTEHQTLPKITCVRFQEAHPYIGLLSLKCTLVVHRERLVNVTMLCKGGVKCWGSGDSSQLGTAYGTHNDNHVIGDAPGEMGCKLHYVALTGRPMRSSVRAIYSNLKTPRPIVRPPDASWQGPHNAFTTGWSTLPRAKSKTLGSDSSLATCEGKKRRYTYYFNYYQYYTWLDLACHNATQSSTANGAAAYRAIDGDENTDATDSTAGLHSENSGSQLVAFIVGVPSEPVASATDE
eukprot:6477083-Amphidinium_carterae.1